MPNEKLRFLYDAVIENDVLTEEILKRYNILSEEIDEMVYEGVTRIGVGAFTENKISKVIIPASVTFMGYGAFDNSTLKTAIIKNTEGSIEFEEVGGPFSDTTTVIYDPNYTE